MYMHDHANKACFCCSICKLNSSKGLRPSRLPHCKTSLFLFIFKELLANTVTSTFLRIATLPPLPYRVRCRFEADQ